MKTFLLTALFLLLPYSVDAQDTTTHMNDTLPWPDSATVAQVRQLVKDELDKRGHWVGHAVNCHPDTVTSTSVWQVFSDSSCSTFVWVKTEGTK